jgi:hypothetical protein
LNRIWGLGFGILMNNYKIPNPNPQILKKSLL